MYEQNILRILAASFLTALVILSTTVTQIQTEYTETPNNCDPFTGPYGKSACLLISTFDSYQRAVCLNDSEIQNRSNGNHKCSDDCRQHCWYPCMLENYNKTSGIVNNACACNLANAQTTDTNTGIPSWCFKPQGESNFFRDCLQKRHNCSDYQVDIIGNLTFLTEWYTEVLNNNSLPCDGRDYLRNHRKCFLDNFKDLLDSDTANCTTIQERYRTTFNDCFNLNVNISSVSLSTYELLLHNVFLLLNYDISEDGFTIVRRSRP